MTHRLLLSFITFVVGIIMAMAIPASHTRWTVTQPDGTALTICLAGDEHHHGYFTTDIIPVIQSGEGWYYAVAQGDSVVASNTLAHDVTGRSSSELSFCADVRVSALSAMNSLWKRSIERFHTATSLAKGTIADDRPAVTATTGKRKGLVILVQFSDLAMKTTDAKSAFTRQFNEEGYNLNYHIGSVHDYFYDQSYGQFDLTFDVVGPYTVSNNYSYYGANKGGVKAQDSHPATMVGEACKLANGDVNYSDYDWDGDGEVDQVYVIYAGYAESNGASSSTIWPHKSALSSLRYYNNDGPGALTLDGVTIDIYACSSELADTSGTTMTGIGTACHEFSHCLGFPDLYDTDYSEAFGMGMWDLLAAGSYNGPYGNGTVPCGYSAYERWQAGWLTPTELTSPCIIGDMPCLGDSTKAYILYNDNHRDEYFLLENRQANRWFSYLAGAKAPHGLLVTHVDYDKTAWQNNTVNDDPKHQRLTIVPADNSYGATLAEYQGDVFPGSKNVTAFDDGTHSASDGDLFNVNTDGSLYLHKPVDNISESNGRIAFYFMGGETVDVPSCITVSNRTESSFSVSWNTADGVESSSLELSELTEKKAPSATALATEDFSKFKSLYLFDGFMDLSSKLDSYTSVKGWKGYKVFSSPKGVKIGTSSTNGYLTSPSLSPASSTVTVKLSMMSATSSTASVQVQLLNSSGTVVDTRTVAATSTLSDNIAVFTGIASGASYKVKVAASGRIYIGDIGVYDEEYSLSDFSNSTATSFFTRNIIKTVSDITSHSYTFTGLESKKLYIRLNANKELATSAWSDYYPVDLTTIKKGDANGDGITDKSDARLTMHYFIGKDYDFINLTNADTNGDGNITIYDANTIINTLKK